MRLLRTRWGILSGTAIALVLAGLLAWSLPAALARDERARVAEGLEQRLAAAEATADRDRSEDATVRSEVEAIDEDTASARERLEAAEKAGRKLRRELRGLRDRLAGLGG